jgi:glycopeptide antibiotics resistance protein
VSYILSYLGKIAPFAAIFSLIYLGVRGLTLKKSTSLSHEIGLFLYHLFLIAILSQTITSTGSIYIWELSMPSFSAQTLNIIPFKIFSRLAALEGERFTSYLIINLLGNILLFIPLGFFHRLSVRKKLWQSCVFGLCLTVGIEVFQLFLPRATDIDDIILNFLGVAIGAAAASWLLRYPKLRLDRFEKTQQ